MKYFAVLLSMLASAAFSVSALDAAPMAEGFNEKINTWVDGTITAVDVGNLKIVVHGAKDKYATEYARMMRDIHNKTNKLTGADRDNKESEIRRSYANDLQNAQNSKRDSESDFTLYLPSKDSQFMLSDESKFYGKEFKDQTFNDRIEGKNAGLADLQVGEHVAVGYESGVVANHLYAVIRNHTASTSDARQPINTGFRDNANNTTREVKPDNTAVNQRDRHPNEVTADQQGNNAGDLKITQDIRAALVKDGSLSTYAKNVKIITLNGQVTLKGPVKSDAEKTTVENTAKSVAGERVMSAIEVTK